jgi:ATPase subunit of ABC transporter with duplicated ATPase domains
MKPEVLLLDEPGAGLDEKTCERITELLAAASQSRIVISHDRDSLSHVTDSIYSITSNALKAL